MAFDRFEKWEMSHEAKVQSKKSQEKPNKQYGGIGEQYGITKKLVVSRVDILNNVKRKKPPNNSTTRPDQSTINTLSNFKEFPSMQEINKKKKVEKWLQENEGIAASTSLQKNHKERKGSSSSTSSSQIAMKRPKVPSTLKKKLEAKDPISKEHIVIESDSSACESHKENKRRKTEAIKETIKKESSDITVKPNLKRNLVSKSSKTIPKKTNHKTASASPPKIKLEPQVKKEEPDTVVKTEAPDDVGHFGKNLLGIDDSVVVKKEVKSPRKIMRPASFILKPTGDACIQTDIGTNNLKDLLTCAKQLPAKLQNQTHYKFKVNLRNDQFAHRDGTKKIFDTKSNDLSLWLQEILNNYKSKREYPGNEDCSCFITLDSRFKVMAMKDTDMVQSVVEVLNDGSDEDNWMRNIREPIRIHSLLDKQIYAQALGGEVSALIPDLIITRIFPKTTS